MKPAVTQAHKVLSGITGKPAYDFPDLEVKNMDGFRQKPKKNTQFTPPKKKKRK